MRDKSVQSSSHSHGWAQTEDSSARVGKPILRRARATPGGAFLQHVFFAYILSSFTSLDHSSFPFFTINWHSSAHW